MQWDPLHIQNTVKRHPKLFMGSVVIFIALIGVLHALKQDAYTRYEALQSVVIYDRKHVPIGVLPNEKDHYNYTLSSLPDSFSVLLLKKEDRYFYYHPGINPISIGRAIYRNLRHNESGGGSTITLQLAKILLGTEGDRTIAHKLVEIAYAVGMELFGRKDDILLMYANTVFMGNQIQGFEAASHAYFNKSLSETTVVEQLLLLATLSHPNARNPWKDQTQEYAQKLHADFFPNTPYSTPTTTSAYAFQDDAQFELKSLHLNCERSCTTTIDAAVTRDIRAILSRHIEREHARGARNGAVVVIDPKTSELIAVVGTGDTDRTTDGAQINMAIEPRPIGSTVKPFIYLAGFEAGLRPYTIVDDREYRYPIATGYPLYPKNYDGKYHGEVTLHTALSNSLNVPSVKILEYVGLEQFYQFLLERLNFMPIQALDEYQYGIALGGLETDLLTLTHYFTIFPRLGTIAPLTLMRDGGTPNTVMTHAQIENTKRIAEAPLVALVHAILRDRQTGVGQFGLKSNLNLTIPEYGVKTGTSRDFHDSWVVGYTGDFVVGVWLGNSENEALEQISGQSGAGAIWHDVMEYLIGTDYYRGSTIPTDTLTMFPIENSMEWGLPEDVVAEHESLLMQESLITSIHEGDTFEYTSHIRIPLRAKEAVAWYVNGTLLGEGTDLSFTPQEAGMYEVTATSGDTREILNFTVIPEVTR